MWSLLAEWLQVGGFGLLLLLLPFSNAVVEISFGLILIGWLMARLHPATGQDTVWRQPTLRPLLWAMAIFWLVCAASITVSPHPELGVRALFGKWGEYLLLTILAAEMSRRPRLVEQGLKVLAFSAALVVFEGVTQERFEYGFFRNYRWDHFHRMTGPYRNPIDLATYLMVIIPILAAWAWLDRHKTRWRNWLLVLALFLCFLRTQAVGAWLGIIASLGFFAWRNRRFRRLILAAMGVMALAGGLYLGYVGRLGGVVTLTEIGKQDRLAMWQSAIHMIQDRPVLGHGLNTFMANYLHYRIGGERQPRYAHNCYLQMAAETGLIGLAAFLGMLWLLFHRCLRSLQEASDAARWAFLFALLVGLVGFVVQAGGDTNFYSLRQSALFWTMAGFALGLGFQPAVSSSRRPPSVAAKRPPAFTN